MPTPPRRWNPALLLFACCTVVGAAEATVDPPSKTPGPAVEMSASPPSGTGRRGPTSAATPQALAGKALERHGTLVAKAKAGGHGMVLIGDSITDWWPGRGKSSWAKLAPYRPLDLGWAGQHTEHVLWRLQNGELDGVDPRLVMILIGTNNLGHVRDEQPAWVAGGVAAILGEVRQRLPKAHILLMGIFPRGKPGDSIRERITATNAELRRLADRPDITFLDLGPRFLAEDGSIPKDLMGDGLHPGSKGYEIWFDGIKPTLDRVFAATP